jgi:ComF family protein
MILRQAVDGLASLLFPAPCRICGEMLVHASTIPVCEKCLGSFEKLGGPGCDLCGRPFASEAALGAQRPLCHLCRLGTYGFDRARSFSAYTDPMHRAILMLKYEDVSSLGGWFAARLEEVLKVESLEFHPELVVVVPLDEHRLRERGYNQAERIAKPLAWKLGVKMDSKALKRQKPRPEKLMLSRSERWKAARGAFVATEGRRFDKKKILLIDDVFTTGATLDACARALRQAGAAEVFGLTVARAIPDRGVSRDGGNARVAPRVQ